MSDIRTMIQGIWSDVLGNKLKQGFGFLRCGVVDKDGVEVDIVQAEGIQTSPQMLDEFGNYTHVLGDNIFKGSPVMIPVEHHEIHCGDSYEAHYTGDLGNGATDVFAIIVPNEGLTETEPGAEQSVKQYHLKYVIDTELESSIEIYEGATLTANGTAISIFNRNRNATTFNDFLGFYLTPTVTDNGTLIYEKRLGSDRKIGGTAGRASEYVLKDNTTYLVRITNQTSNENYYNIEIDYYVHPGI